jgi:hypothetical protein
MKYPKENEEKIIKEYKRYHNISDDLGAWTISDLRGKRFNFRISSSSSSSNPILIDVPNKYKMEAYIFGFNYILNLFRRAYVTRWVHMLPLSIETEIPHWIKAVYAVDVPLQPYTQVSATPNILTPSVTGFEISVPLDTVLTIPPSITGRIAIPHDTTQKHYKAFSIDGEPIEITSFGKITANTLEKIKPDDPFEWHLEELGLL